MFVDEIEIHAKAGDGGDGVVRWRHEKFKPKAGPAGGNGGNGGDIVFVAVSDLNRLAKYRGEKKFTAPDGENGRSLSQYGKNAPALSIEVPVGSVITDHTHDRQYELLEVGQEVRALKGGNGGLGNEYFKSSTNRAPQERTTGRPGEAADFTIEVALIADVGLVGLPSAGKSTLLNTLTAATSKVGDYPFTTLHPHLGKLYEFTVADVPGLIEGASAGKGLGHQFLRHLERTSMLVHVVSLATNDPEKDYYTIRGELSSYKKALADKPEWILFTKKDLVNKEDIARATKFIDNTKKRVFVCSLKSGEGVKEFRDSLVEHLRTTYNSTV